MILPPLNTLQSSLEGELERVRSSVDNIRSKLGVGLEIENHLKKKVRELERKRIASDKMILNRVAELRHYHSEHKVQIMNLLDMEKSHIKIFVDVIEEKIKQFDPRGQDVPSVLTPDEYVRADAHISTDAEAELVSKRDMPDLSIVETKGDASEAIAQALQEKRDMLDLNITETKGDLSEALAQALQEKRDLLDLDIAEIKDDASGAFAQALQEKVAALLLLSQQEERHLLERNVNAALQKRIDELQRNLFQVTNEKVKALLELAQLKRRYQLLQEKTSISNEVKQGNVLAEVADRRIGTYERDGKLKNILKKTYLRRWVGSLDGNEAEAPPNSMDFVRMRIENATLKENMESMDLLTNTLHRLRLSLLKESELMNSKDTDTSSSQALDEIITEAKLMKTALGSSLPVSWSAEGDGESIGGSTDSETGDMVEDSGRQKIDPVSAAGFEMLDLLILAAQVSKEKTRTRSLTAP